MDVGRAERLAALAALIGLAAPALSGVQMLRDFGLAAAIGGAVALAGIALLVPAAIALSEQPQLLRLPRTGRAAVAALARRVRRA
jgi:predicted RND superfamily exporter protein